MRFVKFISRQTRCSVAILAHYEMVASGEVTTPPEPNASKRDAVSVRLLNRQGV